jgi:hypothetical protein
MIVVQAVNSETFPEIDNSVSERIYHVRLFSKHSFSLGNTTVLSWPALFDVLNRIIGCKEAYRYV